MLKAIRVCVILLTLTGAARAGEIIIPPASQPVKASDVQVTPADQVIPANDEDTTEETVSLTQIALAVLVSLLP